MQSAFPLTETDPDTGLDVVQLTNEPVPTDPIYGEQPFGSKDARRLVVRHQGEGVSGLSVIDLADGATLRVETKLPGGVSPAFHAWGDAFFYQRRDGDRLVLCRAAFGDPRPEPVCELVGPQRGLSYGTVSQDERWYASVEMDAGDDARSNLWLWDLRTGEGRVILESEGYFCKHEQFSLDGTNRLMLQCNFAGNDDVGLGIFDVESDAPAMRWLAASGEHTLRPSGHEAWLPGTDKVFFSTRMDEARNGNLWLVGVEDEQPEAVVNNHSYVGHVAVSRCAQYWIGDGYHEPGTPMYMGMFGHRKYRRAFDTHTGFRGKQVDHTHPYLTADNRWLVFGSSRTGRTQVYAARLTQEFLASLAAGGTPRERPAPTRSCPSV